MIVIFDDLGLGRQLIDYRAAWDLQREIHAEVVAGSRPDTVLLLEHEAVYTAGKRTQPEERPTDGAPVVDVDRGGNITWHGPGQLVAYPIVTLPEPVRVVDYVRRVEEAMIRTFADLGLESGRVDGRSGVWLAADKLRNRPERKIAQIGIRVTQNVTMHGLAMNISNAMSSFDKIVPCGISDAGVTSLAQEFGTDRATPDLRTVADLLQPQLIELLSWQPYDRSPDIVRAEQSADFPQLTRL
ncbi:lipoyl(octanoyl) transferase LipB [Microlunatus soli]|uniref:Octanoyltransferase n=1 Tax=Microlunatus soli TaxID=630515 RepID=A0A1H1PUD3_9ACTN|nr:lipoyl(octanoyl) transferase LipB [Microlunatus soli]SDS14745.1 lipoyl(octanoyl) transferase [Microlunatus soli]